LTDPGTAPSMRSSKVLPDRPTPAMYSTFKGAPASLDPLTPSTRTG
jgi:hypothetical protein